MQLDDPILSGMVHRNDPETSVDAAKAVARNRTDLHARVLAEFASNGPMDDEQLEMLSAFRGFGPSTIRKRRSELYQQGALIVVGQRTNSRGRRMLIWGLAV